MPAPPTITQGMAILTIDRRMVRQLLHLPDTISVMAVHFDAESDRLLLRVEGEGLPPEPPEHERLILIRPTYCEREAVGGERIIQLMTIWGAAIAKAEGAR